MSKQLMFDNETYYDRLHDRAAASSKLLSEIKSCVEQ